MKVRLTITIDTELAGQAKRIARLRKTSVSEVVEAALRSTFRAPSRPAVSFSEHWTGRLGLRPDDPNDLRLSFLKAKHRLTGSFLPQP